MANVCVDVWSENSCIRVHHLEKQSWDAISPDPASDPKKPIHLRCTVFSFVASPQCVSWDRKRYIGDSHTLRRIGVDDNSTSISKHHAKANRIRY
jgi:hypothetical protein